MIEHMGSTMGPHMFWHVDSGRMSTRAYTRDREVMIYDLVRNLTHHLKLVR